MKLVSIIIREPGKVSKGIGGRFSGEEEWDRKELEEMQLLVQSVVNEVFGERVSVSLNLPEAVVHPKPNTD